ncbi:hypothetical protein HJG60_010727 [Phyllostomus discolor]|uniref:Uncharacterized protein n=1 Tax=Phyllostomus discolor TaxID=89673 RepID=A0A834EFD4_9CHIR|nr:hypothetical protein HJG60_010727 [Phyllostomus discolor]
MTAESRARPGCGNTLGARESPQHLQKPTPQRPRPRAVSALITGRASLHLGDTERACPFALPRAPDRGLGQRFRAGTDSVSVPCSAEACAPVTLGAEGSPVFGPSGQEVRSVSPPLCFALGHGARGGRRVTARRDAGRSWRSACPCGPVFSRCLWNPAAT